MVAYLLLPLKGVKIMKTLVLTEFKKKLEVLDMPLDTHP